MSGGGFRAVAQRIAQQAAVGKICRHQPAPFVGDRQCVSLLDQLRTLPISSPSRAHVFLQACRQVCGRPNRRGERPMISRKGVGPRVPGAAQRALRGERRHPEVRGSWGGRHPEVRAKRASKDGRPPHHDSASLEGRRSRLRATSGAPQNRSPKATVPANAGTSIHMLRRARRTAPRLESRHPEGERSEPRRRRK
jgi:hypothetical protein